MKKYLSLLCFFLVILGGLQSCGNDVEPVVQPDEYFGEEESEADSDTKSDESPIKKRKYDLSVLSEECLEMLDVYEEMQAKMKDASNAAKKNRADQELQDEYYLLLQENQKLLSDARMVNCSNDVNFQYAMSDIASKYFD